MELYSSERLNEVVETGEYCGRKWVIKTLGTYPCAYVENIDGMTIEEAEDLESPYCGISYSTDAYGPLKGLDTNISWLGWDYGHALDYNSIYNQEGMKHTIEEIRQCVKDVIDELEVKRK